MLRIPGPKKTVKKYSPEIVEVLRAIPTIDAARFTFR
jgi:hypothetical protein